jgi:GNAT superfamily N-acetyltransferase
VYTRLSDGTELVIRSIVASDKQMLSEGLARLSEESRRLRFLTAKPRFTSTELRYLTEVDGCDHYAVVAQPLGDPSRIVGVARWVRQREDRQTAEPAITVADALQRRGVGRELGIRLAEAARCRGIRRFVVTAASDNPAVVPLMRTMNAHVQAGPRQWGISSYALDLVA